MAHVVRDPDYEARVRASFARQKFMATLGARLESVAPGEVIITLSFRDDLVQQHGFMHAGALTSVVDSACGYAALTLMEPGAAVLAVEFKVNLMAPASGTEFRAVGRVVRAGRTLTVCAGEFRSIGKERDTVVALMQGTMMAVRDKQLTD
ncbi:MAG: PaaI family thioesterase [Gemmatimonadetes bacterium]|nr:PaaI family thioesterase [Gemmatimonadota bacterium]